MNECPNPDAHDGSCCDGYEGQIAVLQQAVKDHADRIATLEAALTTAKIELGEAADKMHVLGLNHPGGNRYLDEDKAFMLTLAQRFDAAEEAARAALAGGEAGTHMSEWQPIETAPRDGSDILLWLAASNDPADPIGEMVVGYWLAYARAFSFAVDINGKHIVAGSPTHWMPLPKPPGGEGGGEAPTAPEKSAGTSNI